MEVKTILLQNNFETTANERLVFSRTLSGKKNISNKNKHAKISMTVFPLPIFVIMAFAIEI
jgi:hypothetical protein